MPPPELSASTAGAGFGAGGALDQLCVNIIRTLSMDAVQAANSGHPDTPTCPHRSCSSAVAAAMRLTGREN
jgi:hypothetical protein